MVRSRVAMLVGHMATGLFGPGVVRSVNGELAVWLFGATLLTPVAVWLAAHGDPVWRSGGARPAPADSASSGDPAPGDTQRDPAVGAGSEDGR